MLEFACTVSKINNITAPTPNMDLTTETLLKMLTGGYKTIVTFPAEILENIGKNNDMRVFGLPAYNRFDSINISTQISLLKVLSLRYMMTCLKV